jgi:hypothetical protein
VLAHAIGAPLTVILSGVCCVAGAGWFFTQAGDHSTIDSANLCRSRHPAGGERSASGQRGKLTNPYKSGGYPHLSHRFRTILAIDSARGVFNNCCNDSFQLHPFK